MPNCRSRAPLTAVSYSVIRRPKSKLIAFSDYLCTSCQNYEPVIRRFIQDYVQAGRAQIEYRIYPVIDPALSVQSASLVECADTLQPGQFWRARDLMFELVSTRGFTDQTVAAFADELRFDHAQLTECAVNADQHAIDARYGLSLGAGAAPSLFVQYGEAAPIPIALALPEHHDALVNATRPQSTAPVLIERWALCRAQDLSTSRWRLRTRRSGRAHHHCRL